MEKDNVSSKLRMDLAARTHPRQTVPEQLLGPYPPSYSDTAQPMHTSRRIA